LASKNAGDPEGLQKYLETRATSSPKAILGDRTGVSKLGSRYKVSSEEVRETLRKTGWELDIDESRGRRFWRPQS
jgi:hypothetical protein